MIEVYCPFKDPDIVSCLDNTYKNLMVMILIELGMIDADDIFL